jgi:HMG box factor
MQFSCYQENLAQTARSAGNTKKNTGAVVDNEELNSFGMLSKDQVPDFKTQLDQWLTAETVAMEKLTEEERITRQERTTFVISFGIWDLWSLRETDYNTAIASVDRRIKKLTEQLNRLDESFKGWGPTELQIIMTQTMDVTFLPAFTSASGDEFKDAVRVLTEWNSKLKSAATEWKDGKAQWLYMFDTNAFVLDRIRDWQLYASGIEEENGMGKNIEPGWENVSAPCVVVQGGFRVMMSRAEEKTRCQRPEKYLFW